MSDDSNELARLPDMRIHHNRSVDLERSETKETTMTETSAVKPTELVATFARYAEYGDDPIAVRWNDGTSGTVDDFRRHQFGTYFLHTNEKAELEWHMLPYVVADISFDPLVQDWVMSGTDVQARALNLKNPNASDHEIGAVISACRIVYRVNVIRWRTRALNVAQRLLE